MPRLLEKRKVLNGRATVVSYDRDPDQYFLRVLIPGTTSYRTKLIPEAADLISACEQAIDVWEEFQNAPVTEERLKERKTKSKASPLISTQAAGYVRQEEMRWESGDVGKKWYTLCRRVMRTMVQYLESKGIEKCNQIDEFSFDDYRHFRKDLKKTTFNKEVTIITKFLKSYLARRKLIAVDVLMKQEIIEKPKVFLEDIDGAPAMTPEDWHKFQHYVRTHYVKLENYFDNANHLNIGYWRNLFYTFCIVSINSGCRPIELLELKWKHVTFRKENSDTNKEFIQANLYIERSKNKTPRHVITRGRAGDNLWKWHQYQEDYIKNKRKANSRYGVPPTLPKEVNPEHRVFGLARKGFTKYAYANFEEAFNKVMEDLVETLKFNKTSSRIYSIYSFRHAFIENHIRDGTKVYDLAKICGHTVEVMQQYYDRTDILHKTGELGSIPFGVPKIEENIVSPFNQ